MPEACGKGAPSGGVSVDWPVPTPSCAVVATERTRMQRVAREAFRSCEKVLEAVVGVRMVARLSPGKSG